MLNSGNNTQSLLIAILIIVNILFLLLIINYLTDSFTSSSKRNNQSESLTTQQDIKSTTAATTSVNFVATVAQNSKSASVENKSLDTISIENTVTETTKDAAEITQAVSESIPTEQSDKNNNIDVYYDGNLARVEEKDNEGNLLITITKSLDDIGELSTDNANYLDALKELKQGIRSHVRITKTTVKEAKTYQVNQQRDAQSIDYFNKVDVSNNTQTTSDKLTLADQIAQIVSEPDNTTITENVNINKTEQDYIHTLKTASFERSNEMRVIQVASGDTLWNIAERAYGSGHEYPRIYKANPHLTNPDRIEIGDYLRVPL